MLLCPVITLETKDKWEEECPGESAVEGSYGVFLFTKSFFLTFKLQVLGKISYLSYLETTLKAFSSLVPFYHLKAMSNFI